MRSTRRAIALVAAAGAMFAGCVHVPTREERLASVGPLRFLGEHEQAVRELRALRSEAPVGDHAFIGRVYVELVDNLLALKRHEEAVAAGRLALATPGFEREPWLATLVAVADGNLDAANGSLRQAMKQRRVTVAEFAEAEWLRPLRDRRDYATTLGVALLSAGGLSAEELNQLNAAGGIRLQPLARIVADPSRAEGSCSLAVVQVTSSVPVATDRTRFVGELVAPRVEGTGTNFVETPVRTTVRTNALSSFTTVAWGPRLRSVSGFMTTESTSTMETTESRPETTYSVVLNPQNQFAEFEYVGLDDALLPNRTVTVFGCVRQVGSMKNSASAAVLEVIAYLPFDADGLPVRRTPSGPMLSP